jgi:hypothetical protein
MLISLNNEYSIAYKGDLVEVDSIEIQKPTMEGWSIYAKAKSLLLNAFTRLAGRFEGNENINKDAKDNSEDDELPIEAILLAFDTYDLEKYQELINEYLYKYGAYNGKIPITKANLKKLSIDDYNKIMGVVSSFLLNT